MRKVKWIVPIIALAFIGCATLSNTAAWGDKSPKEKSLYFIQLYNQQYDDTMFMATNPNITDAQKRIVVTKKNMLTKLWPMIRTYDSIAANGGIPSAADEQAILVLINDLVTMAY